MSRNFLLSLLFSLVFIFSPSLFACTRILHIDPQQGVMVGRNMDWFEPMSSKLVVYPRGLARYGMADGNSIDWTSRYGSIITLSYNLAATDGMNEKGLAIHGLWLDASDYGQRDVHKPGISLAMLMQFYLDNFKSVEEAVQFTRKHFFQVEPFYHQATHQWVKIHVALEDASGDSAIIEYIKGKPVIYHNRNYTVMTNEPTYPEQLKNLQNYSGFGGIHALPGTASSTDRFVRATYFGKSLPSFKTTREEVAAIFSVLQNASPPFLTEPAHPGMVIRTNWRTVSDLTRHVYYFNSTLNLSTIYVQLDKFLLTRGSPVMILDLVKYPNLSGDVSSKFVPV